VGFGWNTPRVKPTILFYFDGDPDQGLRTSVPSGSQAEYILQEKLNGSTAEDTRMRTRRNLLKRRWQHFNRDMGADLDLVHGIGTYAKLGVDRWKVTIALYNQGTRRDRDVMSVWIDNIGVYEPPRSQRGPTVREGEGTLALEWPPGLRRLEWSTTDGRLREIDLNGSVVGNQEYGPDVSITGPGGEQYAAAGGEI
jgi:hypothetical protein